MRNTKSGLFSESEAEKIRVYVAGVADNDPRVATTYATERANNTNLPSAHYAVLTYESRNGILVHKSTQTPMVTAEAADDTADSLVKAYRSTLDNHNKGSKRGLKAYAAKHRHIHGGFGSLLERKWQNRPNYTPEDFAAVKSEPAVAAFIAEDDAAGTYNDCLFACLYGQELECSAHNHYFCFFFILISCPSRCSSVSSKCGSINIDTPQPIHVHIGSPRRWSTGMDGY